MFMLSGVIEWEKNLMFMPPPKRVDSIGTATAFGKKGNGSRQGA